MLNPARRSSAPPDPSPRSTFSPNRSLAFGGSARIVIRYAGASGLRFGVRKLGEFSELGVVGLEAHVNLRDEFCVVFTGAARPDTLQRVRNRHPNRK